MTEKPQQKIPFGILVFHGFTATIDSVSLLVDALNRTGLPVRAPLLAGHGSSSPEALRGITCTDWLTDAEKAFGQLSAVCEKIILVGHSMGALLALHLAAKYEGQVDSLVLAAPAIKLFSLLSPGRPLYCLASLLARVKKKWDLKTACNDQQLAVSTGRYPWVPTDAILSFFLLIEKTITELDQVKVPVLILHNRRETTVLPESATMIYNTIATGATNKAIVWLEHSEHQMFCDSERELAVRAIADFIDRRVSA
ncbi:MAG: alpha/beta fold hydrolase [Chlorobiaceae bacterium]|jgi:carboxylesterase|nr:alpha/beta fold hydrolase [Chlorobiaceae bacterium]NTW64334.1 alpha/beta fold hydrolase [Chlorobiaceae bacterium]